MQRGRNFYPAYAFTALQRNPKPLKKLTLKKSSSTAGRMLNSATVRCNFSKQKKTGTPSQLPL